MSRVFLIHEHFITWSYSSPADSHLVSSLSVDKCVMASMSPYNSINRIFTVLSLPVLPILPIPLSLSLATVGLVTVLRACSPESHRVISMWGMRPLQTDFWLRSSFVGLFSCFKSPLTVSAEQGSMLWLTTDFCLFFFMYMVGSLHCFQILVIFIEQLLATVYFQVQVLWETCFKLFLVNAKNTIAWIA